MHQPYQLHTTIPPRDDDEYVVEVLSEPFSLKSVHIRLMVRDLREFGGDGLIEIQQQFRP